jgi:hypothetical protein
VGLLLFGATAGNHVPSTVSTLAALEDGTA